MSAPVSRLGSALVVSALALGCGETREPAEPRREPLRGSAETEPVDVVAGGRTLRVRCAVGCEDAARELLRLRMGCELDPLSTPHHVSTSPAMIRLGCCTEAESAYQRGCGTEGIEACVSRWSAACARGEERGEDEPAPGGGA